MAPPSSPAWQYFTVQEHGMARCHLCHKFIRIVRNTSPLVAHLRCKHPEVFEPAKGTEEIKDEVEMEDASTQTSAEDFTFIKSEEVSDMEFDMKLRVREIMASRLEDAVGKQESASPEPMVELVKILCESSLWMLRDWPGQKPFRMDNYNSVRGSRMDALGRLRTMLRRRPPKNSELDGLIVLLSDAVLTISEQWPGGEPDTPPQPAPLPRPPSHHQTPVLSSLLSAPSTSLCPTPPKMPRITARQYPVPKAPHAGGASLLWRYFAKVSDESGQPLAKCTICGKIVSRHNSGTTCMKNHLFSSHPSEYSALGTEAAATFSNPSQASSPGVSMVESEPAKKVGNGTAKNEGATLNSAIIAALNGSGSPLESSSTSPLFNNGTVKEEELDIDETLNQFSASFAYNEPSTSQSELTTADVLRPKGSGSDIWTYFTKGEENGERFGCCTLCDWKGKTYNYGTNNMWSHLKRTHPAEYTILKPFEHNPAVHGQIYFGAGQLGSTAVPAAGGTIVVTPGAPIPSHLTLPREPSLVDGEVKEEEEELFD